MRPVIGGCWKHKMKLLIYVALLMFSASGSDQLNRKTRSYFQQFGVVDTVPLPTIQNYQYNGNSQAQIVGVNEKASPKMMIYDYQQLLRNPVIGTYNQQFQAAPHQIASNGQLNYVDNSPLKNTAVENHDQYYVNNPQLQNFNVKGKMIVGAKQVQSSSPTIDLNSNQAAQQNHQLVAYPSEQNNDQPLAYPAAQQNQQHLVHPAAQKNLQPHAYPPAQQKHQSVTYPPAEQNHHPVAYPAAQQNHQPVTYPAAQNNNQPVAYQTAQNNNQPVAYPAAQQNHQAVAYPAAQKNHQPVAHPAAQYNRQHVAYPFAQQNHQPVAYIGGQFNYVSNSPTSLLTSGTQVNPVEHSSVVNHGSYIPPGINLLNNQRPIKSYNQMSPHPTPQIQPQPLIHYPQPNFQQKLPPPLTTVLSQAPISHIHKNVENLPAPQITYHGFKPTVQSHEIPAKRPTYPATKPNSTAEPNVAHNQGREEEDERTYDSNPDDEEDDDESEYDNYDHENEDDGERYRPTFSAAKYIFTEDDDDDDVDDDRAGETHPNKSESTPRKKYVDTHKRNESHRDAGPRKFEAKRKQYRSKCDDESAHEPEGDQSQSVPVVVRNFKENWYVASKAM